MNTEILIFAFNIFHLPKPFKTYLTNDICGPRQVPSNYVYQTYNQITAAQMRDLFSFPSPQKYHIEG